VNEKTLLDILTGGRYSTAQDLPTAREVGSSAIDKIIESDRKRKSEVLFSGGKNIFGKPTKEFKQGDLEDLITGIAGTTKPVMSAMGLGRRVPNNPIYHITKMSNMKSILDRGIKPMGGRVSFTRDSNLQEVYGFGKKKVQLLIDKDQVEKYAGKKLYPFSYKTEKPKAVSRFNESEERLYGGLGAPLSSIKAIRLKDLDTFTRHPSAHLSRELRLKQDAELVELIKDATKKYIPIVTDKKYKKNIEKLIDEITSVSDWDKYRDASVSKIYLKQNIYYTGKKN
tara:strand:- start:45 stop:893 length:849 start_codon:yes stop_codon:yes gene_type:complete